jgi:hypothetical protein
LTDRIYQINADLAALTTQLTRPAEVRMPNRTLTLPRAYDLVRENSADLYRAFQKIFEEEPPCTCTVPHMVNMQLQSIAIEQSTGTEGLKMLFQGALFFRFEFSVDK